jgi:hypothetical protein
METMSEIDGTDERSARRFALAATVARLATQMHLLGLLGMGAGWVYRELAGVSEHDQLESWFGTFLARFFACLFVTGLLVVWPSSAFLHRRAVRLSVKSSLSQTSVEEMPSWLRSLWAIATFGALFLIYVLLWHAIPTYFRN